MSGAIAVPQDAGVIAVLVRGDDYVTVHRKGTPSEALRAVVELCDEGEWQISVLSSPVTIYRDLDGSRAHASSQIGDYFATGVPPVTHDGRPERAMLGRIGRLDLLRETHGQVA